MTSPVPLHPVSVVAPAPLPLGALVIGKPVGEVVELIPRLFNLCRAAQSLAVRMACGLATPEADHAALGSEIARDHRLRLSVLLPARLGITADVPRVLPDMTVDEATANAPVLARVRDLFAPGQAVSRAQGAENSVAGRNRHHALMQQIEADYGRGPLWRVTARCLELTAPALPAPQMRDGWAEVPAARGTYRLRAEVTDGHVTAFERRTPTDDMLLPGGPIQSALETLHDPALAPLLLEIIDPCVPLTFREALDA